MAGANGSSRWTDALLDRMRELGDPVADMPVAAVLERGGVDAVSAIMRTLVRVDQPRIAPVVVRGSEGREGAVPDRPARYRRAPAGNGDRPVPDRALNVGGLDEDGKGRRTIQRVRLMHAAVRHLIRARNEQTPGMWHPDLGTPINQEDLAGTLLAFSYVVADPICRLGVRVPAEDVDAYLHLWNVMGHLLGVRDELFVRDVADAAALSSWSVSR